MADFEKVYSIKFNVNSAIKSLEKLEEKVLNIKKSGLIGYLNGVRVALGKVDKYAEKAGNSLDKNVGKRAQQNLKALGKEGRRAASGIERIQAYAEKAGNSLDKNVGKRAQRNLKALGKEGRRAASGIERIQAYAGKAGNSLDKNVGKRAQRNLKALGKEGRRAASGIERIPAAARMADVSLQNVGRTLNRWVLAPLAAASIASLKFATDMNKGMANVSTLVDQTPEQLEKMKRSAQSTMVAMGKGTEDVTGGLYQVISALGESDENMDQLGKATKAAVAGLSDTKSSVEMLTAVAKAYNDTSAESIEKTSDLAFQTVKLGVTTFPELAASIGKVAPLAAQFNTSQEELFGTMATLTGVTGSTSEVVTQLASSYAAFMKPSEAMANAVERINKANKDYNFKSAGAMLKTLGYSKTIKLLGEAAGGSEEKLMAMFRRKEAILGILPLISSQSENYAKKLKEMQGAAGATDEAFRKQTEGVNKAGFQLEQTKQRGIVLAQRWGDKLIPQLVKLMDYVEGLTEWFDSLSDEQIETAINVGKTTAQFVLMLNALRGINAVGNVAFAFIGKASSQFGAFNSGIDTSITKVGGLSKAMRALQGTVAVLGALALGYTIGDLIDKGLIAPRRDRDEREATESENRAIDSQKNVKNLSSAEIESRLSKSQSEKTKVSMQKKAIEASPVGYGSYGAVYARTNAPSDLSSERVSDKERRYIALTEEQQSLINEKKRRQTGLPGLQKHYETAEVSAPVQYFDADIVRSAQIEASGASGGVTVNHSPTYNVEGQDYSKVKDILKRHDRESQRRLQRQLEQGAE